MIQILDKGAEINEETLKLLEGFLGFRLPQKYRSFLAEYNGGRPEPNCFNFDTGEEGSSVSCLFGINRGNANDLVRCIKLYTNRIPSDTFPIGCDAFGNVICLVVKGPNRGKIYFWDHEFEKNDDEQPDYSNMTLIANNFDDFISGLCELEP